MQQNTKKKEYIFAQNQVKSKKKTVILQMSSFPAQNQVRSKKKVASNFATW